MNSTTNPDKLSVLGIYTDWNRPNSTDTSPGAIGWYRIVNPIEKLGGNVVGKYTFKPTAENAMEMKALGDIWFSKLSDNDGINLYYGAHRDFTGAKLILDLDDDPININVDHPEYEKLQEKKEMRVKMLQVADHVVCSTEEVAAVVRPINPYVTVIPNAIDPEIWGNNKKKRDGKIRIGWMASGSHLTEFPFILPALREIADKYPHVEIHFAGIVMDKIESANTYHHIGTKNYAEFPQWYANLGIDIAIAPLIDTPFNRCKSNIKWMEAAMLEIPCVCSPTVYEKSVKHGKTGYIAKSAKQFVKYLSWLIESEELRKKIGAAAKQEVLSKWTIDKFLPQYRQLFDKIMEKKDITVVTAIDGGKDNLLEQPQYPGVEYVAFTEQKSPAWKTRDICRKFSHPVMNAKIHKLLTHRYVDTEYIVWIDGNITLKRDPHELVKLMGDKEYAFFTHPRNKTPFEEAELCIQLGKGDPKEIAEQVKDYAKADFNQEQSRLCEMTCFIRRNSARANESFEAWWTEVTRYSERDQIAFPVVFQKEEWATIPGSIVDMQDRERYPNYPGNDYFKIIRHLK